MAYDHFETPPDPQRGYTNPQKSKTKSYSLCQTSHSPLPLQKGIYGHIEQLEENPNWFEIS